MSATDDRLRQGREQSAARLRGRALALGVALVIAGTLGAGWLADSAGVGPPAPSHVATVQQIGFSTLTLSVSPAPLEASRVETLLLRVTDASGRAVRGAQVGCALSMTDMAMTLPRMAATPMAQDGVYACATPPLDAGRWALDVTLTLATGETGHATFQLYAA